jgi:hypothetical protein
VNGNLRIFSIALALAISLGGLVWNASSMNSGVDENIRDIENLGRTQAAIQSDIKTLVRDVAQIKAQNTIILERVGGRHGQ